MKYNFQCKRFEETHLNPDKLAVAGSDGDLDWKAVQQRVEQFARTLRELKIPAGHPVMIFGHKEQVYPLAMLACIHCSIPYIPLDRIYPAERIQRIAELSGSQVMINCGAEASGISFAIEIDRFGAYKVNQGPDFNVGIYGEPADPIQYIMFTSGSTGEPKGVQITQSAVAAFLDWTLSAFDFRAEDVFMNQAPFTFDISLYDVLCAFSLGGTMVLNAADTCRKQDVFLERIAHYKCSVWVSTPSFVFIYLRHPEFNEIALPQLRIFFLLGEEFPNRTAKSLRTSFSKARLYNGYGPTEATVATTLLEITDEIIQKYPALPIGYAMPGAELFIDQPHADTQTGELVISGAHVSTGYLKNADLNQRKFFVHQGKRSFRTGDMAREEQGLFFFLGRNDDQVKLHGFRIELNEISAVLCRQPGVADAVTVALRHQNEVKKLVSFVILKESAGTFELKETLLDALALALPAYMVPGDLVELKEFPYGISHKVDRGELVKQYLAEQMKE
jgi:D-alanine--poly(phosphoribitol) ligase subunit 1